MKMATKIGIGLIFLGLSLFKMAMCSLHIRADPKIINLGLTEQLTVNCTFTFDPQQDVADVASLIISGTPVQNASLPEEELASLITYEGNVPTKLVNDSEFSVTGDIKAKSPYLAILFNNPTSTEARFYHCQATVMDKVGHFTSLEERVEVNFKSPDTELLISQIRGVSHAVDDVSHQIWWANETLMSLTEHMDGVNTDFNQTLMLFSADLDSADALVASAKHEISLLKSEINLTMATAEKRTQEFYTNTSTTHTQINQNIQSVNAKLNAVNSSHLSEKAASQRELTELHVSDQRLNLSLQDITFILHNVTERLETIEQSEAQLRQKLADVRAVLFDKPVFYNNQKYYLSKHEFRDMNIAEATCEIFGGYLAEIDTSDEHQFLGAFVGNYMGFDGVLVGGIQINGHWLFHRSQAHVLYDGWAPLHPLIGRNRNCRSMWKEQNWDMVVEDCYNNENHVRFLCEVEMLG